MERKELKLILESLLFASEAPIRLQKFHEIFLDISLKELREILLELKGEYGNLNRSFYLREVANGFQLCTKPEYSGWIKKLKKSRPFRLGSATMEALAIIAYKQPLTRAELEEIRGVDSAGILRALLEKKLIKILGKKDVIGKPLLYGTTPKFLTLFGLKGLKDLPALEEIEQLDENSLPLFPKEPQEKLEESNGHQKPEPHDENQA
ncbi:MAG: SMC-Scp complex subunit ScpB [Deltaproteobacteria bacterium]|nr:SMC-Scp complex subunit ScpB [Deltaproteobacteria bacterium]